MTADILPFRSPFAERLQEAFDGFAAAARTSMVPAPLVAALQSPDVTTVEMTVGGVPVEITVGAGSMTGPEIVATWRRLLADGANPGDRIVVGYPPLELAHGGAA